MVDRRLNFDRLATLHRAVYQVYDFSIALTCGLTDRDWFSRIMTRFAVTKSVPPGEYPSPIDTLELPYCGLIVLHLPDPMRAIQEGVQTIQRCKPVLLVECTTRAAQHGEKPGHFLERLGARELYRAGPDRIYGWAR